jgi:succinate dehydrogenase/fumarate reductase flavoprotein subunit
MKVMKQNNKGTGGLSRRDFVQTAAAGIGITAIGALSSAEAKAITPSQVSRWDQEADVVILGTGFAGQVSAITAHDAGASVLVIEKAPEKHQGGNSRVCGQGIWCPSEAVFEDAFNYLKAMTAGTGYPVPDEYLRFYVRGSHENKAWLESMGATMVPNTKPGTWVPFYPEFPGAAGMASETDSYSVGGSYKGPGRVWYFLEDRIKERKGIRKMYETPGKRLIQDPETGRIRGVVAAAGGREIHIKAKRAVIMCAGGYEFNQQMIRDYMHIQDYASPGSPYNTGDGIKMCMAAGADLVNMGVYAAPWGVRCRVPDYLSPLNFMSPVRGGHIWVGADSKRYKDEHWQMPRGPWPGHQPTFCGSVKENGVYRREKTPLPIHAIFDEVARSGRQLWMGSFASQIEGFVCSKDNSAEIARGYAVRADTVRDLAVRIGRDPDVLEGTVKRWNAACAAGADPEYGRTVNLKPITEAPFYAVNLIPGTLNTQGGMLRNTNGQVLDVTGRPIPRLYAAGEIGDRVWANLYECMKNVGAGCMASGRSAGSNAAAETPWA